MIWVEEKLILARAILADRATGIPERCMCMSIKLEEVFKRPRPTSPDERLAWVMTTMIDSSHAREEYFKYRKQCNEEFIRDKVQHDALGVPVKNARVYGAIHADYIFFTMSAIESFQGAMAAAMELAKAVEPDLNRIIRIVIHPRGQRQKVQKILDSQQISDDVVCQLVGIPLLDTFPSSIRTHLRNLMLPAFERVRIVGHYSQKYWKTLRTVRNVYAHNFRFIFFDKIVPPRQQDYDQYVIGNLDISDELIANTFFVGGYQRMAMGELGLLLGGIERWIYENIQTAALNAGRLTLPKRIPELNKKQWNDYRRIWQEQGYKLREPIEIERAPVDVDEQIALHLTFLDYLKKWGHPVRMISQHGDESKLSHKRVRAAKERIRNRRRPKKKG
jgi:hypothetical protein